MGLTIPLLGVTMKDLVIRFSLPLDRGGVFPMLMSVGIILASIPSGILYSWGNFRYTLALGLSVLMAGNLGLFFSTEAVQAYGSALVFGFGFGMLLVGLNSLVTQLSGKDPVRILNLMNLLFGVGAVISPQLVNIALLSGGVPWAYWYVSLGLLANVFLSLMFLNVSAGEQTHSTREPIKPQGLLMLFGGLFFFMVSVEAGFNAWIVPQLTLAAGMSLSAANSLASLFWAGYTLSRLLAAMAGSRIPSMRMLWLSCGFLVTGFVLMLSFPQSHSAAILATLTIGMGTGPLFPAGIALAYRNFPTNISLVLGILNTVGNIGPAVMPLIQGWASQGKDGGMEVLLASAIFIGVCLWGVGRKKSPLVGK